MPVIVCRLSRPQQPVADTADDCVLQQLIKRQGIDYVHVPVPRNGPYDDPEILAVVTAHLDNLQRPVLVHCRTGARVKAVLKNAQVIA